jgi:hypothetical protein
MVTDLINRLGVGIVQAIVARDLRWFFREQPISDQGIDGLVETAVDGRATGRLVAVQIKSGPSWFTEEVETGWVFRFSERECRLWLGHALPVMVLLVDTESDVAYWERVTAVTAVSTGKGFKIVVPRVQTLATAGPEWDHIASGLEMRAVERYPLNIMYLPPSARQLLEEHYSEADGDAAVLGMHLAEGRTNPVGTVRGLLTAQPGWITRHADWTWRAIATYAAEHEADREAADAVIEAGSLGDVRAGRYFAAAGINIMNISPEESRALLMRAEQAGGAEVCWPWDGRC